MILRDFECTRCGEIHEKIVDSSLDCIKCAICGGFCKKIITAGRVYLGNDDAQWIPSVLEVVDKDSTAQHTTEFIKNPNRTNYKNWMKGEGLRPFDPGERPSKPESPNSDYMADGIMKMRRERDRLEVR